MKQVATILAALVAVTFAGCSGQNESVSKRFETDGIYGVLHVSPSESVLVDDAADMVATMLSRTLESFDVTKVDSDLARLNRSGSTSRVPLTPTTFRFIDLCRHYSEITDGAFDITTGNIAKLWERGIPSLRRLNDAIRYSGMNFVGTTDNGAAILVKPEVRVTPGYASAAYALDLSVVSARHKLNGPVMIQLGLLARSFGAFSKDNTPLLPLRIPERLENNVFGHVMFMSEKSVANLILPHRAGRPEMIRDRYLVDTRTGYPALGTRQVVVMGPITLKAYALAEALLILGKDDGEKILSSFPGYDVMLVPDTEALEVWMTPGFKRQFKPADNFARLIKDWIVEETEED